MSDLNPHDQVPIPITVPDLSDKVECTTEFIGSGGHGSVYKGKWLGSAKTTLPTTIAIKIIGLEPLKDKEQQKKRFKQITRELSLWCKIQHKNILPLLGITRINGDINIPAFVCPLLENGNAKEFCLNNPHFPSVLILYDIVKGLQYLHTFNPEIVHGDIKAVNVLINNRCEACLCDFGLSRFLIGNTLWKTTATHATGTARWMAPELINGEVCTPTKESDMYAYAMTCYEILSGDVPFKSVSNDMAILFKVTKGQRPHRIESCHSKFMWHLMTRCWNQEPKDRLSTENVLELLRPRVDWKEIEAIMDEKDVALAKIEGEMAAMKEQIVKTEEDMKALKEEKRTALAKAKEELKVLREEKDAELARVKEVNQAAVTVSFPEIYARCMMVHGQGYPLYNPEPDHSLPLNIQKTGIRIGDVGLVTWDGSFDFLFNVCGKYQHLNPLQLPDNFQTIDSVDVAMMTHFQPGKHLFSHGVEQITDPFRSSSDDELSTFYRCSGTAGAVLELPEGAALFGAQNGNAFRDIASRHAENWYKYAVMTRRRSASNGSLYLVTGSVKSDTWGVAVFYRLSNSEGYLKFIVDEVPSFGSTSRLRYKWEQSGSVISNVGPSKPSPNKEGPDQCIFLRGYKIMLRQDRWDAVTQSPASPASSSPSRLLQRGQPSRTGVVIRKFEYDSAIIGEGWTTPTSKFHPSDVINMALLKLDHEAKVALCHDVEWCKALPNMFSESHTSLKIKELLDKIGESYEIKVENDCAFLVRAKK